MRSTETLLLLGAATILLGAIFLEYVPQVRIVDAFLMALATNYFLFLATCLLLRAEPSEKRRNRIARDTDPVKGRHISAAAHADPVNRRHRPSAKHPSLVEGKQSSTADLVDEVADKLLADLETDEEERPPREGPIPRVFADVRELALPQSPTAKHPYRLDEAAIAALGHITVGEEPAMASWHRERTVPLLFRDPREARLRNESGIDSEHETVNAEIEHLSEEVDD